MTTVDLELMWLKCSITVDLELMVMKSLMTADGVEALIEHPLVGLYILCNLKRKHQKTRMRLSRFVTNTNVILREYVWSHPYMVYRPLRHADNDPPPPPPPPPPKTEFVVQFHVSLSLRRIRPVRTLSPEISSTPLLCGAGKITRS